MHLFNLTQPIQQTVLQRQLDADQLTHSLRLYSAALERLRQRRRLFATFWLARLLPGQPAQGRNPPGTLERYAERSLLLFAAWHPTSSPGVGARPVSRGPDWVSSARCRHQSFICLKPYVAGPPCAQQSVTCVMRD